MSHAFFTLIPVDAYQGQCPPGVLRRHALHQHIGLWRDNSRVDEAQEEESANQGADSIVGRIWVLPLHDADECERPQGDER